MENLLVQATQQNIDWQAVEDRLFSFVLPMGRTEQNPKYHAEGDVWTHTKLVCDNLVQLKAYQAAEPWRKQVLFLSALLHDIGKIRTTRWEDDRWTSPNHAAVGAKMARQFLWQELGLCGTAEKQQLRETVCNLIRYHSFPPHALEDSDGKRKLLTVAANGQLCPEFSMELLCILCQADAMGRECEDKPQMQEQIALCGEFAAENGCLDGPFSFPSAHTRYAYLSGKNIPPEVELYDDTWGQVILLSGLPGTGKDTWIGENCPDLPMISLDEIRKELRISPGENQAHVVEAGKERAKEFLRKKQSFVWNATNLTHMLRRKQVDLFSRYGASTKLVYLETGWEEQLRRNSSRPEEVPEPVVCHMLEELVPPEMKEATEVLWHCV